jgi:3-oxoacyl-[acyl-carrier-protein] synthase II
MGVAASQLALADARIEPGSFDPNRVGTMFGCDYIMTRPDEYAAGIKHCMETANGFDFKKWGERGLPRVEPLWLLKYLPNMPASHVAIFNDLRGPSNSITMRESSSNLSIGEALTTIQRGMADVVIAGATGSRIHPLRTINTALQEELAFANESPAQACRPFDRDRSGMVIGEGAAMLVLEKLEYAQGRGAEIHGEVIASTSSTATEPSGLANYDIALKNAAVMALRNAGMSAAEIGHVHAHGLSSRRVDRLEAAAIQQVFGDSTPVVAAKSQMGNLGAGSGAVEIIASLLAMKNGQLFPVLNFENSDGPDIRLVTESENPGESFLNLNVTPQGQASAVVIRKF